MCNIRTKGMSSCEFGSTSQVVLIYFNIRGKLQPIRNLLAYLEVPYTELHVEEKHTGQKIVKLEVR